MFEETPAWKLWTTGLDLWREGRLTEASATLRRAIETSKTDDLAVAEYYGSFGQLLSEMGENVQAEAAFRTALRLSIDRFQEDASAPVAVARYFLADHLRRIGRAAEAMATTEPSMGASSAVRAPLHCVRALAHWALGEEQLARDEAHLAIETAGSPEQRAGVAAQLAHLLQRTPT